MYHGNYTTDYKGAREDFATRSGLVNKNLLFNKNELVEIYRCIEDTLNNGYEITDKQKEMLEDLQTRISSTVAEFDELLKEAINQDEEETFEQTMWGGVWKCKNI